MKLFLQENVWKNKKKRGFPFGKPITYLPPLDYHPGQDFITAPVGKTPVIAPNDGILKTFSFSRSAGWWGYYKFYHKNKIYSLKILHMYKQMKDGEYKKGDVLGYCGATGISITSKYNKSYIGASHKEQASDKAVPHLHIELHKGEFKHNTNKSKKLAGERIIDPVSTFEKWINESKQLKNNDMTFYKEEGKSKKTIYIKGSDGVYYPIITGKHFVTLFGKFEDNNIETVTKISPKDKSFFGLFKQKDGKYNMV